MRKPYPAMIIIFLLVFGWSAGYASAAATTPPEAAAPAKEDNRLPFQKEDQWQFFFAPYMWIAGANISTTVLGHTSTVNMPWWDIADDLFTNLIGVMGRFEAWKGKWGFFLDSYFVYIGGNVSDSAGKQITLGSLPVSRTLVLDGNLKYIARLGNLDFGVRYLVGAATLSPGKPLPVLSFELLGGGRYNYYDQYLKLGVNATITGPVIDRTRGRTFIINFTRSYVEPMLGMRLGLWLTKKAFINFRGTLGGFGLVADNNFDSDLELLFGYRVSQNIYACLGYRARYDQFNKPDLSFSAWLHGPVLGAAFMF